MSVDENEATANPQSRRAFLTRLAVLGVGVAVGVAETEATANTGIEEKPNDIDKEIPEGEKVQLAETVDPHDPMQAYGYYGHRRRVARRVYRHRRRVYRRVRRRIVY